MNEIKELLIKKFEELEKRTRLVLNQLNEEELNWRPNESSNSIANLVVHIQGNVNERIQTGILHRGIERDRYAEFEELYKTKEELLQITQTTYSILLDTIKEMADDTWSKTQSVRNQERTHLDVIFHCSAHFSEHLGQMMYIGKMLKNHEYVVTSIPKRAK